MKDTVRGLTRRFWSVKSN